jgi:hypothetical protein
MQQDEEDWQHEASKMSQVYSYSSLNFVAADSPDGDVGCFYNDRRAFPNAWKVTFPRGSNVPHDITDWESGQEIWQRPRQYTWNCINGITRALIDDSRIATRAWTLQERLLSRRTLYFGRDQIAWECRLGNAYEGLSDMFDEGIVNLSPGNFSGLLETKKPFANTDNVRQWSNLVEAYSKRSLSFSRDKLVAISGLARMLAPLYKSDYVAGLWVKDLVRLLAWYVPTTTESLTKHLAMTYRAPSWSWASVDGEIKYTRALVEPLEGEYFLAEEDLPRPPLAKVLGMFRR